MRLKEIKGLKEIYRHRSRYQLIQVMEDEVGIGRFLVLDGIIQLTTYDQHRYHEALAAVPYLYTRYGKRVLILGGGDGYAAGVLLRHFPVEKVTIVDIDPDVVDTARALLDFPSDPRLEVINEDAADWVRGHLAGQGIGLFDLIVADYTDPTAPYSVSLFSLEHFTDLCHLLTEDGVFSVQMVSPFANPKAAACLIRTVIEAFPGRHVQPYQVHLPMHLPPSQNGFCLAARYPMQLAIPPGMAYLNQGSMMAMFALGNDEMYNLDGVDVSTMDRPLYTVLFKTMYSSNVEEWELDESKEDS